MSDADIAVHVTSAKKALLFTPSVLLILSAAFFTSLSTYMAQPYLIIYYHQALGFSSVKAGVLIAVTPLCGALFGVVGGYLSDRFGIRKAYASALFLSAACLASFSFVHAYTVLLLIAALLGLAMSTTRSGAQALLNLRVSPEGAGTAQTALYWLNNLAIVLGPPSAALLLGAGTKPTTFVVGAVIMVVMCCLILLFLRDPRSVAAVAGKETHSDTSAEERDSSSGRSLPPTFLASMKWIGRSPVIFWTFLSLFCYIILEAQLTSTVPLYVTARFTHGAQYYGFMNAEIAALALAFTPLSVRMTKGLSAFWTIACGIAILAIGLLVAGRSASPEGWFFGIFLYGAGEVLAMPKMSEVMAGAAGRENPALSFAAINTSLFLGMFAGYILGAPLFATVSSGTLYTAMIVVALIAIFSFRKAVQLIASRRNEMR